MAYNYKIVISSTWRNNRVQDLFDMLNSQDHCKLIDHLYESDWRTPRLNTSKRYEEIEAWLKANPDVKDYLIVDDEENACIKYLRDECLIKADPENGILVEQYRKMRRILNKRHNNER